MTYFGVEIAKALQKKDATLHIIFVGLRQMEMNKIPNEGFNNWDMDSGLV